MVRETFPILELLHIYEGKRNRCWPQDEFTLARLFFGLPAALQDLRLFNFESDLNIFDYLPPNITKLHNVCNTLPSPLGASSYARQNFDRLTFLELYFSYPCVALPPHLTHLVINNTLLVVPSFSFPPSLTELDVELDDEAPFLQVLKRIPPSITRSSIFTSLMIFDEESLRQLESIQPLEKMKRLYLRFQCDVDEELESTMWTRLLRLFPNVEELTLNVYHVSIGVEAKHLNMLNPRILRSLSLPMNDNCFAITSDGGQSYLHSTLPGLTRLRVGADAFDLSTLSQSVTDLNVSGGVLLSSLIHLPKALTRLDLNRIIVDEWNEEICGLFCAVRTSKNSSNISDPTALTLSNATTMHAMSNFNFSLESRGDQMSCCFAEDHLTPAGSWSQVEVSWSIEPSFLPQSLTKFVTTEDWNFALLLAPQSLPNLKILRIENLFDGIEALETLEDLTCCFRKDGDVSGNGALTMYPPNLTRLKVDYVIQKDALPSSITDLQGSFETLENVFDSLPSLQTLVIVGVTSAKWTLDTIPTTVTHLSLPSIWLKLAERSDYFAPLQRLSNLMTLKIDSILTIEHLEKIFTPSSPPQAILQCLGIVFTWAELAKIASRAEGLTGPPFANDLQSCASEVIRCCYPRLLRSTAITFNGRQKEFSPQLWPLLCRFLSPSTSYLHLEVPMDRVFELPSTIQRLRAHQTVPIQILLDSLPSSITQLTLEGIVTATHTNWPPCLQYLNSLRIAKSGAESLKYLPPTLEHLAVGSVQFKLADYLIPSVRCLEAAVPDKFVSSLLRRTREIGCLWVTNTESSEIDFQSAFDRLVSQLRPTYMMS